MRKKTSPNKTKSKLLCFLLLFAKKLTSNNSNSTSSCSCGCGCGCGSGGGGRGSSWSLVDEKNQPIKIKHLKQIAFLSKSSQPLNANANNAT
ncbi:hypothetical protein BpHYR1_043852 [Brachionus plicatilis]|uniref:Uncharacterized protein n=1 Tax=Brachionus plicatilis TaxID=10195 RepID=A0A3M7TAN2_BRAPC|nr:hypothetical protein BpHYR1_043852 [Brachionus plicatilis]